MNILYDYEIQVNQRFGGVSKYFYEIISRIKNYENTDIDLPVIFPKSYDMSRLTGKKSFDYPYRIAKYISILNSVYLNILLKFKKYDVIHQTQYGYIIPRSVAAKVCVTIHDMIWEKFTDTDPDGSRAKSKKRAIDRSDMIIAISETTKKDLLAIYPDIPEDKISVIHHGVSYDDDDDVILPKCDWVPDNYILYVGTRNEYKNFYTFAAAMVSLMQSDSSLYVICTGYKAFTKDELSIMTDSKTGISYSGRFIQKKCSDSDMKMLYQNAKCFVFPSKYEGFGMPILESFACDCPVILSDTEIFREVAGYAGVYFNPDDASSIEDAVSRVIYSDDIISEYKAKGKDRMKEFSWDKCAQKTYSVYNNMVKNI